MCRSHYVCTRAVQRHACGEDNYVKGKRDPTPAARISTLSANTLRSSVSLLTNSYILPCCTDGSFEAVAVAAVV